MPMAPFFGVPFTDPPPAEVRSCMQTQLGIDIYLNNNGALGEQLPYPNGLTEGMVAVARRFCSSLNE